MRIGNNFIKSSSDKSNGDRDLNSQYNQNSVPDVSISSSAAKSHKISINSRIMKDEKNHLNDQNVIQQRDEL